MVIVIRCWNCHTKNGVDAVAMAGRPDGLAFCGKCHKPMAKRHGHGFLFKIGPYRPPKPRGICGCCGQKPYPGDKLYQGFCPDCWANMDGMGRPPRRI